MLQSNIIPGTCVNNNSPHLKERVTFPKNYMFKSLNWTKQQYIIIDYNRNLTDMETHKNTNRAGILD